MVFYGILLSLLVLAGIAAVLGLVASWILGPIDKAAKGREAPMQFTLGDFLGLMFLAQLPMGALLLEHDLAWAFVGFGWFAFTAMWLAGVRTISRAGIENPWHRALFVGLVIPASVCGCIALLPLFLASLAPLLTLRMGAPEMEFETWGQCFAGAVGTGLLLYGFGRLTRRMLAGRRPGTESAVDDNLADSPAASDPFDDEEENC